MDIYEILKHVDHTLLAPEATKKDIRMLCDDAVAYGVASVCIPPSYVRLAKAYVQNKVPICTVIGFPNGYQTTAVKVAETADALEQGAQEIDMVINVGWVKDGEYDLVKQEIAKIKEVCATAVLKVIVETCLLTEEEKIHMCHIVTEAGADYIKTSTGFSKGGATFDDISLFASHVGEQVKIKAAGGISNVEDAAQFLKLGAQRLGTSRIVKIAKDGKEH